MPDFPYGPGVSPHHRVMSKRCVCGSGVGDRFDVINRDASVTRSLCFECFGEADPVSPRPPDPAKAQWLADHKAALDDYLAKGGDL